jgi:hypothetical protein
MAGEGGTRRESDGRVRVRQDFGADFLTLTPALSRDAGEGAHRVKGN